LNYILISIKKRKTTKNYNLKVSILLVAKQIYHLTHRELATRKDILETLGLYGIHYTTIQKSIKRLPIMLKLLVKKVIKFLNIYKIIGDSAYSYRKNIQFLLDLGIEPIIFPKKSARKNFKRISCLEKAYS
jgi:hypothetical protein